MTRFRPRVLSNLCQPLGSVSPIFTSRHFKELVGGLEMWLQDSHFRGIVKILKIDTCFKQGTIGGVEESLYKGHNEEPLDPLIYHQPQLSFQLSTWSKDQKHLRKKDKIIFRCHVAFYTLDLNIWVPSVIHEIDGEQMPGVCSNGKVKMLIWESLALQGDQTSHSYRKSTLSIHWKDWCWNRNSNTLATWWDEPLKKTLLQIKD